MEEHLEVFEVIGEEDNPEEVEAYMILEAIAERHNVRLWYTTIKGILDIKEIEPQIRDEKGRLIVKGDLEIIASQIISYASFTNAIFHGYISFMKTNFSEDAYFINTVFEQDADFTDATFSKYASFINAAFAGNVYFPRATFGGDAYLNAVFNEDAIFSSTLFSGYASFNDAIFSGYMDLSGARFNRDASLGKASFRGIPIESYNSIGWAYRKSSIFGGGIFFELASEGYWKRGEYSDASEGFRNAKLEYEKEGRYGAAGKMHVREQDSIRRELGAQEDSFTKHIIRRSWFLIWKYTSNYGESPWRFIGWAAVIVIIFALIYLPVVPTWLNWWPSITFGRYPYHEWSDGFVDGVLFNFVTGLYYSMVTFATLGFGDITPISITGKVFAVTEVLIGYLMFGVLITLVARKMTRS